ncbi:LytR C-terminal domain-containing protein [Nocardioides sp.]|uniref:LytR C-terminal domain-containing protein n=1 Tax=Nocardioides sp. TaxID=35761 RepID=UPI0035153A92
MSERSRPERGLMPQVAPSGLVLLSAVAVLMAGLAFVLTRGEDPAPRDIAAPARAEQTTGAEADATPAPTPSATPEPTREPKPDVDRSQVFVEVYNNTAISGLAGEVGTTVGAAGWQVVGTDNWYGTIPATTVYYPDRLKREARQLARDLGVDRIQPAVAPMKFDRLTLILTGEI